MDYYHGEASEYFEHGWTAADFSPSNLPEANFRLLLNAISNGISGRSDISYLPLIKFQYADGHEMITLGGMIGTDQDQHVLLTCDWGEIPYIRLRNEDNSYNIHVPRLTRKERLFLDKRMPCPDDWKPDKFELPNKDLLSYREIYRFYPVYAELLL